MLDHAHHTPRNWGIDCLRGASILLVVLHHFGLGFRLPLRRTELADWLPKRLLDAFTFNGYEAVFVFFVISGFLIASQVLTRDGALASINWRGFYWRRASRIVPLLLILLALLCVMHWLDVPGYRIKGDGQSLGGALFAALGLHLNWYEGRTTWLPASWDVLWSLSIEETFYLAFPLVCLWLPRRALWLVLLALALAMPVTKAALEGREIWQEKAYLPAMGAIAVGVLCALAAQRWRAPPPWLPRLLATIGGIALLLVLLYGDMVWHAVWHGNLLLLTAGAGVLVLGCHFGCRAANAPRGLGWLAAMGRLSYEIYLSHMFVVLTAVAWYRAAFAPDLRWAFLVYVPGVVLTVLLGWLLALGITQPCERALRNGRTRALTARAREPILTP